MSVFVFFFFLVPFVLYNNNNNNNTLFFFFFFSCDVVLPEIMPQVSAPLAKDLFFSRLFFYGIRLLIIFFFSSLCDFIHRRVHRESSALSGALYEKSYLKRPIFYNIKIRLFFFTSNNPKYFSNFCREFETYVFNER